MTSSSDTIQPTRADEDTAGVDARLRQLVAKGFQFMQSSDDSGEIASLVGVRGHDQVIDVIQLEAEDHVVATRVPGDEENVLSPSTVSWRSSGEACAVIDELLGLPDDRTPGSLILPA